MGVVGERHGKGKVCCVEEGGEGCLVGSGREER